MACMRYLGPAVKGWRERITCGTNINALAEYIRSKLVKAPANPNDPPLPLVGWL